VCDINIIFLENSAKMSGIDLIGKYPIPRYIPPQKYKSDKGEDNIYPFNHLGFNLVSS